MDKNKSIDGLNYRRSKKATSSPKPKTVKKVKVVAKTTSSKKTTKVSKPAKTIKQAKPTPTTTSTPTEDFLKPVQAFNFDEDSGKLQAIKNPIKSKATTKNQKIKKPMSKKRKIILSNILTILILLLGAGIWLVIWGNDIIAKITGGQGNVFDLLFQDETYVDLKTDENGRTNILAFGTSGYNMDGEEGNGIHDGAQLTDSIMLISLNQETGDIAMLSLPRDLKASPTCTATSKINEVYWCNNMDGNNEQAGAEALMTEVGNILGVDFQYYAHLNWGALVQIVNILDGIKVTLDENIADYYYTKAVFDAGVEYTIDGEQALGLARARHGTSGGDFSRGASQQKILIGIKDKVLEKGLSITDMIDLAGTLGDNLRTNFSIDEMRSLAHLTSDFDFNIIRQISLIDPEMLVTTGNINNISYVLPVGGIGYYTRIQNYVTKMLDNDPRVYEDPSILVLNATEEIGIASAEKDKLEEDGYNNINADDAPAVEYNEELYLYALTDKPGTKSLLEKYYSTTALSLEDLPENISQEYDFVIIINKITEK